MSKPRVKRCRNCPSAVPGWWAIRPDGESYEFPTWRAAYTYALWMTQW